MKKRSFRVGLTGLLLGLSLGSLGAQSTPLDPDWSRQGFFYQVFVRSFADSNGDGIGDLKGVQSKLDYIKGLGANALWLMPIHPSPTYHGYDVMDYRAIAQDYGTLEDFKSLLKAAHGQGLKIIIDWVVNHTSSQHPWFVKALAGDPVYKDYYVWSDKAESGSWGLQKNGKYAYFTFGPQSGMPDLNYNNPQVRKEILDAAAFWLDLGVDGFRLDVAQAIGDGKRDLTIGWWKEFQASVKKKNPQAFVVGEVNFDAPSDFTKIAPYYAGMDSAFDFPIYNHLTVFASGFQNDIVTPVNKARSGFKAYQGRPMDSLTLGNHDRQRLASFLKFDPAKIKKAFTVLFTLPGRMFLYYGDEIGMRGGHDRQGDPFKREPMDWFKTATGPGQVKMDVKNYTAEAKNLKPADGISVEEQTTDGASILAKVKALAKLRQTYPVLWNGNLTRVGAPEGLYAYKITSKDFPKSILVVHNQILDQPRKITLTGSAAEAFTGKTYTAGTALDLDKFGSLVLAFDGEAHPLGEFPITNPPRPQCKLTIKVTVPEDTPPNAVLWMPNSIDGWEPAQVTGNPATKLKQTGPRTYEITVTREGGSRLEYKFFRGSWETSETEADGNWNGNREFLFLETENTVEAVIDGWRDVDYKGK